MKCPKCGYDMANKSKCLRCGYTARDIVLIDPEKIEKEEVPKEERREINPDDVRVSRAGGGSIFDSIFGSFFGGSMFGGLFESLFGEPEETGYEYDPKYYDDFGNEIYLPDEFERESVVIDESVITEEQDVKKENGKARSPHENKNGKSESRSESGKGQGSTFKEKVADKFHNIHDKIHRKPDDKRRRD